MEKLPDIYYQPGGDYAVLLEIGRWEQGGRRDGLDIEKRLGLTEEEVTAAVGRLWRGKYVEVIDASTNDGEAYLVTRLTTKGLQEVGHWPKEADLAQVLQQVLEKQALELDRSDPGKAGKLREVGRTVADLGTTFTAKIAAELLAALARGGSAS